MAIYVPNVKGYFPDVQPFTPDYKFLSDILDKRTDKYESNHKALNNTYSQIVYSDLGREDTKEARDQFVNKLQPTIEKISGLDLSLAQNVNSAKAVFQPFYDNDLIVADMVQTQNINSIKTRVNNMRTSSKKEVRDRYYDQGFQFAMYQYQDFLNASKDKALNEPMARYIENPQLYKRAKAYLDEKGYKIKLAPKFSKNGAYKITTTNGEDVTSRFLAEIRELYGNDPLVQDAYFADAYVQARTHAETGMEQGIYNNVTDGMAEWNKDNIESSRDKIALQYDNIDKELNVLNSRKKKYDDYLKDHSFIPGSEDDIRYRNILNDIEGKAAQMELLGNAIDESTNLLNSNDSKMINDRGFNILFQSNIEHDLFKAADNYSFLTKEVDMEVDELYKIKYQQELNMQVEGYKSRLRQNEERLKSYLRTQEKIAELELEGEDIKFFTDLKNTTLDSGVVGIDDDGKETTDAAKVNPINTQEKKILELGNVIDDKSAQAIIDITRELNSGEDNPFGVLDDKFTTTTGVKLSSLSETEIKNALISDENRNQLTEYLSTLKDQINADVADEKNVALSNQWSSVFDDLDQYRGVIEKWEKTKVENFSKAERANKDLQKMVSKGIPTILKKDANNNPIGLIETFEEYEDVLLRSVNYAPTYQTRGRDYVLKKEYLDAVKNGEMLPGDFITQKKTKDKNGNVVVENVFNSKYFTRQERRSYGGAGYVVKEAEGKNVQETEDLLKNIANEMGESYDVLNKMFRKNTKERKDFDKQIEILNHTFRVSGAGDSGLYEKFDVNADLEGQTTTGDLITQTGKIYDLRAFGESEHDDTKKELKKQYNELYKIVNSPYAEFTTLDGGVEASPKIRKIFNQAISDLVGIQNQKEAKSIANIKYFPNIETGKGGYIISFFDVQDPNTKDNYQWSNREFKVAIPKGVDNNPYKVDQYQNYYIASKLRSAPQQKFTWDYYQGSKIDVYKNSKNQVEYTMHYPLYNAKTGNLDITTKKYIPISYDLYEQNDEFYQSVKRDLKTITLSQLQVKREQEKIQYQKNQGNQTN